MESPSPYIILWVCPKSNSQISILLSDDPLTSNPMRISVDRQVKFEGIIKANIDMAVKDGDKVYMHEGEFRVQVAENYRVTYGRL